MTEINHAGYYMNNKPRPEAVFKDVECIFSRPIRYRKAPHDAFVVTIKQVDYTMTVAVRDILIGEEIGCRMFPTKDERGFAATKLVFTDKAKCVVRDHKMIIVPLLEE